MASSIGSSIASFGASYIPDLTDTADIQTALKSLYFGSTGAAVTTNGIYGALYTLYTGNPTLAGNVTITGDLTVNGTTVTVNVSNLLVEDQEIVLGNVASPSNTTANGGGIRLEAGAGVDKTITWDSTNANWTTSENWNLATGKTLKINNSSVISGTGTALVLGENATTLTLGASSTGAVTTNISVGATNLATKTINLGTGASSASSSTIVNIGSSSGTGGIFFNGLTYRIQPTPTTGLTTSQTLTMSQLETLIITTSQSAPITLTLPTGTDIEGGLPTSSPNGTAFEFSIINSGSSGAITLGAGGNTFVGSLTVAVSTSATLRVVKNATNSFTVYRIG
jgi:hypothetical protein